MKAPSLIVAGDGTQLAMIEEGRVTVVDVATMRARAEVGLAGAIADSDVALVGIPLKLLIVTRLENETRLYVVDPSGPEKLGEAATRANMRLGAVAGDMALLIGPTTALADTRAIERPAFTLPVRGAVTAAGSVGDSRMVLVMSGALEEWDATTRSPARRLRLDRPLDVMTIGGSERRIWMVLRPAPDVIEIINVQTRSTRVVQVPEPIVRLHAHAYHDVLIAVGATNAYVVRADRDQVARVPKGPLHDCVWIGNQLCVWPVDGYPELVPSPVELGQSPIDDDEEDDATTDAAPAPELPVKVRAEVASQGLRSTLAQPTFSERLENWRSKLDETRANPAPPAAVSGSTGPLPPNPAVADVTSAILDRRAAGGWRGDMAAWARSIAGRSHRPLPYLDPGLLDEMMVRFDLAAELRPAMVLLYGTHLNGGGGVPRSDLASVIDWKWDALATGPLVDCGLVRVTKDRFELRREACAALDQAAPRRGTLAGSGAGDAGLRALIAPATIEDAALVAWAEKLVDAKVFIANARGHARLDRFLLEARIRSAVPIVPDDASAHGLTVVARWAGLGVASVVG